MVPQMQAMADHMGRMARPASHAIIDAGLAEHSACADPAVGPLIHPMIDMAQAFDNAKNDDFFFYRQKR